MPRSEKYLEKRRIDLETRLKVLNAFPGDWESIFHGEGNEFLDLREYEAGDDFKKIHLPTLAKTGDYFVREHIALKDLRIFLAVDLSPSMGFRTKPEMVDLMTGLLGSLACKSSVPFGFLGIGRGVQCFFPIRSGWAHVDKILGWLLSFDFRESRGEADFVEAKDAILSKLPLQSVLFLLSDFSEETPKKELGVLSRHYDTIAIIVRDMLEISFPEIQGEFSFRDYEGDTHTLWLDLPRVKRLNAIMKEDLERTTNELSALGVDTFSVSTPYPEDCYQTTRNFFRARRARRRRT